MKKNIITIIALIFLANISFAQVNKILRTWVTVDDKTGEKRSEVRIYKTPNGKYCGKVEKIYEEKYVNAKCEKCKGEDKNKNILGLVILKNLEEKNGELQGEVLDPESGDIYHATVSYDKNKNMLKLRGSIDRFGLLGRSQYWLAK